MTSEKRVPSNEAVKAAKEIVKFIDSAIGKYDRDGEAVIVTAIARIIDAAFDADND